MKIFLGDVRCTSLTTIIGIVGVITHVTSSQTEWKPSMRFDI